MFDPVTYALAIKNGGGGGGGTSNYNQLSNKPQINSVELSGNKSLHDLGIAGEDTIGTIPADQWVVIETILS